MALVTASALATLIQLPGVDRETAILASQSIGNNAAQVIGLSESSDELDIDT